MISDLTRCYPLNGYDLVNDYYPFVQTIKHQLGINCWGDQLSWDQLSWDQLSWDQLSPTHLYLCRLDGA